MGAKALLDEAVIADLRSVGDRDFLVAVIASFFEVKEKGVTSIAQALQRADAKDFERSAHKLKSSCSSVGAKHAAQICQELELRGRAGHLDEAEKEVHQLEEELVQVGEALRALVADQD